MRGARRVERAASRVALSYSKPSTTEVASVYRLPTISFPRPRLSPPWGVWVGPLKKLHHEIDKRDPEHVICKGCGMKLSPITVPATRMDGKFWRDGLSRTKGLLSRVRVAFEPQHSRGGVLARLERFIDRDTNRYFEKVTMCDSGEIVHECDVTSR
jgi:hypothetical protein